MISLRWDGAVSQRETVMILLKNPQIKRAYCSVDGSHLNWEKRGNRLFITLPDLPPGEHRLDLFLQDETITERSIDDWKVSLVNSRTIEIKRLFLDPAVLNVGIYDVTGRLILSESNLHADRGIQRFFLDIPLIPSGQLIIRISDGEEQIVKKLTVIR